VHILFYIFFNQIQLTFNPILLSTLIETSCFNNPATFVGIPHSGFLYLVFDRCFGFVLSQDKMKTEERMMNERRNE